VRFKSLKYLLVVLILAGLMERSHVPVFSLLAKHVSEAKSAGDQCTEDPARELENLKEFSGKDYIHQLVAYRFESPVFYLYAKQLDGHKSKFPNCFYPDVATPPPNC
jgi:hypothetical protein